MKTSLKPANSKARALLRKLQALAEQGIDGEKVSAQRKITRLKARFDFTAPDPAETPDLFFGHFTPSRKARPIYTFQGGEYDITNAIKWAIESTTPIRCIHRDKELLAEASPVTSKRLSEIATHIAHSFRTLIDRFAEVKGVSVTERAAFVMGLYDGMMNEQRNVGQRLPSRASPRKTMKGKKPLVAAANRLDVHPYTLALGLGKQIRFSAPLQEIAAELEAALQKRLT